MEKIELFFFSPSYLPRKQRQQQRQWITVGGLELFLLQRHGDQQRKQRLIVHLSQIRRDVRGFLPTFSLPDLQNSLGDSASVSGQLLWLRQERSWEVLVGGNPWLMEQR